MKRDIHQRVIRRGPAPDTAASASQSEAAYQQLKQAITTLELKPGHYLNTAQLMERMAMGRTPINQALHRLKMEGLISIIPRKGVLVAPLSVDEAFELIEVRLANEELCARLAAARITPQELDALRAITEQYDASWQRRDTLGMMDADQQFHAAMAAATRNQPLVDILRVLHARAQRFWAVSLSSHHHAQEVTGEHRAILDSLEARDGDAAAAAVRAHIESFRANLVARQGPDRALGP